MVCIAHQRTAQTVYAHICAVRISAHVYLCAMAAHYEIKRTGERTARAIPALGSTNCFIKAPHIAALFLMRRSAFPRISVKKEKNT